MNTKQLWQALANSPVTEPYFDGVFPIDALKEIKQKPKLIICNTDPSNKPGEHWVLFFFNRNGSVDFFDSLGKNMNSYSDLFRKFASRFASSIKWTDIRMQPLNSSLCRHYCLYYAHKRCKGEDMESIVASMTSSADVVNYVNKKFNICQSNSCKFQCCINN